VRDPAATVCGWERKAQDTWALSLLLLLCGHVPFLAPILCTVSASSSPTSLWSTCIIRVARFASTARPPTVVQASGCAWARVPRSVPTAHRSSLKCSHGRATTPACRPSQRRRSTDRRTGGGKRRIEGTPQMHAPDASHKPPLGRSRCICTPHHAALRSWGTEGWRRFWRRRTAAPPHGRTATAGGAWGQMRASRGRRGRCIGTRAAIVQHAGMQALLLRCTGMRRGRAR
jgi:hypothetical protein